MKPDWAARKSTPADDGMYEKAAELRAGRCARAGTYTCVKMWCCVHWLCAPCAEALDAARALHLLDPAAFRGRDEARDTQHGRVYAARDDVPG